MSTINETIRTIRVGAVQMESRLGQIATNLEHAIPLAEQAARNGAQIIVLPETASSGYSMSHLIWDAAETRDGRTMRWLRDLSAHLGVYVGIGFVEADGDDFFDAYALGAPDGRIAGTVLKTMAETYIFRCGKSSHVIDTEIGKIGIGICADNHFAPMVRLMQTHAVDLMLMPHALPGAFKTGGAVNQHDIEQARDKARSLAPLYAHLLGVPAVFANAAGPRGAEKWAGILGSMMTPETFRFLGLSTIADSDGTIKGALGEAEGVLVAEVTLDPARKTQIEPKTYGRYGGGWVQPIASPLVDVFCHVDASISAMSYSRSSERRRKARAISSQRNK